MQTEFRTVNTGNAQGQVRQVKQFLMGPCETSGWTLLGSQKENIQGLAWLRVSGDELLGTSPKEYINMVFTEHNLEQWAVFLTSADLGHLTEVSEHKNGLSVKTVCTVGLGNALRAGDPGMDYTPGTINIACELNRGVNQLGRIEGLSIMTEAKTLAVIDQKILSFKSGLPATGTGTDCSIICSPQQPQHDHQYLGKHTIFGELIGRSVYKAVSLGIEKWKSSFPNSPLIGV